MPWWSDKVTRLGFGAALAMLAVVGGIAYRHTTGLLSTTWLTHTHRVLDQLEDLAQQLAAVESRRRAYLLTGEAEHRAALQAAVRSSQQLLEELGAATADDPRDQRRLDRLAPLLADYRELLSELSALSPPEPDAAGQEARWTTRTQALVDGIHRMRTAMGREAQAVLRQRVEGANAQSRRTLLALLLGGGASLALLSAVFRRLRRELAERTRAEQALRDSERRFRSVTQSAVDGIIAADGHGRIIAWNPGAEAIFGYREDEVLGQPLTLLMPARYREAHRQGLERLRLTGRPHLIGQTVELYGLHKDGREFPVELSLAAWESDAGRCYSGIVRDITRRKQAEAALRQKTAFVQLLQASAVAANEAASSRPPCNAASISSAPTPAGRWGTCISLPTLSRAS
jgi:PAS domain S-box-containing protein